MKTAVKVFPDRFEGVIWRKNRFSVRFGLLFFRKPRIGLISDWDKNALYAHTPVPPGGLK